MARRRRNPIARGKSASPGDQNKTSRPVIKTETKDNMNKADYSLHALVKHNYKRKNMMKGAK